MIVTPAQGGAGAIVSSNELKDLRRPSFFSNCLTVLGAQAGRAPMALALEICYARLLGPAGRGQLSLCLMAIAFGSLLGGLGGEIPMMIWTAEAKKRPSEYLPAIVFWGVIGSACASLLWSVVYWGFQPAFFRGITPGLADLVLVSIPAGIFFSYGLAMLAGKERFGSRAAVLIANQVAVLSGFLLFAYWIHSSAEMAALANLLATLLALAATVAILKNCLQGKWNLNAARAKLGEALSLGVRGQLGNLVTFFNYRLDVFLVNYFLNPAQVGLYALGVILSESLWQLPNASALALLPRTARTLDEKNAPFTCLVTRQTFALAFLAGIPLALASPWLVPLVFGVKFKASVAVVWWILPGTIALAPAKVMCADLAARGMPEYSSIFAFVALLFTVALDVVLIPRMGINGAALASSLAYLVDAVLVSFKLKSTLGVTWKFLFVPASADFVVYRQAWTRVKASWRLVETPVEG